MKCGGFGTKLFYRERVSSAENFPKSILVRQRKNLDSRLGWRVVSDLWPIIILLPQQTTSIDTEDIFGAWHTWLFLFFINLEGAHRFIHKFLVFFSCFWPIFPNGRQGWKHTTLAHKPEKPKDSLCPCVQIRMRVHLLDMYSIHHLR